MRIVGCLDLLGFFLDQGEGCLNIVQDLLGERHLPGGERGLYACGDWLLGSERRLYCRRNVYGRSGFEDELRGDVFLINRFYRESVVRLGRVNDDDASRALIEPNYKVSVL